MHIRILIPLSNCYLAYAKCLPHAGSQHLILQTRGVSQGLLYYADQVVFVPTVPQCGWGWVIIPSPYTHIYIYIYVFFPSVICTCIYILYVYVYVYICICACIYVHIRAIPQASRIMKQVKVRAFDALRTSSSSSCQKAHLILTAAATMRLYRVFMGSVFGELLGSWKKEF